MPLGPYSEPAPQVIRPARMPKMIPNRLNKPMAKMSLSDSFEVFLASIVFVLSLASQEQCTRLGRPDSERMAVTIVGGRLSAVKPGKKKRKI